MHSSHTGAVSKAKVLLAISSPSGVGKTSICQGLLQRDGMLRMSVSMTTRLPRCGEIEGVHYFFVDHEQFQTHIEKNYFVEHAFVFGNHYGTPLTSLTHGQDVLFDIDGQGVRQLKQHFPQQVVSVFLLPPSIQKLHQRLQKRGQDSEETIRLRMQAAKRELDYCKDYDYVLINDDFDRTLESVQHIVHVERLKRQNHSKGIQVLEELYAEIELFHCPEDIVKL